MVVDGFVRVLQTDEGRGEWTDVVQREIVILVKGDAERVLKRWWGRVGRCVCLGEVGAWGLREILGYHNDIRKPLGASLISSLPNELAINDPSDCRIYVSSPTFP